MIDLLWVAGLTTVVLAASGCGKPPEIDPLKTAPAGSKGVAYVNFKQLADADLTDGFLEIVDEEGFGDTLKFLRTLDVDLKKDVLTATIILGDGDETTVALTGKFDTKAMQAKFMKRPGAAETEYKKKYDLLRDESGQVLCIIKKAVLLAGDEAAVHKVLDILKGDAQPMAIDSPLMSDVAGLADYSFWLTKELWVPEALAGVVDIGNVPERFTKVIRRVDIPKLRSIAIGGKVAAGVIDLTMTVGCAYDQIAERFQDGLRAGLVRLTSITAPAKEDGPKAAKLVDELIQSVKIETKGTKTTATIRLRPEVIDALRSTSSKAAVEACKAQLKKVPAACDYYMIDKGKSLYYPRHLRELAEGGMIRESDLACPADALARVRGHGSYDSAFDLSQQPLTSMQLRREMMVAWDNAPRHGGKRCAVFLDGRVELLDNAAFQKHLEALKAALPKKPKKRR